MMKQGTATFMNVHQPRSAATVIPGQHRRHSASLDTTTTYTNAWPMLSALATMAAPNTPRWPGFATARYVQRRLIAVKERLIVAIIPEELPLWSQREQQQYEEQYHPTPTPTGFFGGLGGGWAAYANPGTPRSPRNPSHSTGSADGALPPSPTAVNDDGSRRQVFMNTTL